MVAWYWLIITFISGLVFATISWNAVEWDSVLATILAGMAIPFVYVAMFPIVFFRCYFNPITPERWENYASLFGVDKCRQIGKTVYLWHDTKAKKLYDRWFLIRVKPIDSKEEKCYNKSTKRKGDK